MLLADSVDQKYEIIVKILTKLTETHQNISRAISTFLKNLFTKLSFSDKLCGEGSSRISKTVVLDS
jgi:hypothetical protein